MGRGITLRARLIRGAALTFAGITAACAHVGQEQFDSEIAALRAEMEQTASGSNRQTEAQMARLEARLLRFQLSPRFDLSVVISRLSSL